LLDVLLSDRLVFPTPRDPAQWDDWKYEPELLRDRLEQLGTLAVEQKCNQDLQKQYSQRLTASSWRRTDHPPRSSATSPIEVIADTRQHAKRDTLGNLTFLLGQKFLVPDDDKPEEALKRAIDLSGGNEEFQTKRRELFEWQD
jgi:hypothetical protein